MLRATVPSRVTNGDENGIISCRSPSDRNSLRLMSASRDLNCALHDRPRRISDIRRDHEKKAAVGLLDRPSGHRRRAQSSRGLAWPKGRQAEVKRNPQTSCCNCRSYNKTLLLPAIFVSPESALTMEGLQWRIAVLRAGQGVPGQPEVRLTTMRRRVRIDRPSCPSLVHRRTITPPLTICPLALRSRTRK